MNVDNVKSQMRKGMLEYCILLLLHRESAYSSDIIQKLKEARLIVAHAAWYHKYFPDTFFVYNSHDSCRC